MKSLAVLAKYMGSYDKWERIRQRYQLKWSSENVFHIFSSLSSENNNYEAMVQSLKKTCLAIPEKYKFYLLYCTVTGLRPSEACKSIELINKDLKNYLNQEYMMLEHFKYPHIFIRRTKNAYVSLISNKIIVMAQSSNVVSYNAIRMAARRIGEKMNMNFCRKIFATHLRINGIEQETIDLLQGRVPRSVFARHYFRPDFKNDNRVIHVINALHEKITE